MDSDAIRPDDLITQAGPNRPRVQENLVFLLVPDTVEVTGEHHPGDDMLDNADTRAMELSDRLQGIAIDVLARRTLKLDPTAYGLSESVLSDQTFSRDSKEREQALLTVVTQSYRNLWFPGQGGKIVRREISTAGGEGGRSVIESIREVLLNDGELVTAELAASTTASASAAQLFFGAQDYQTLAALRDGFACRRDWPVLEDAGVFDTLIRSGVRHGAWCLFLMGVAESEKPVQFYSRETDEIPFSVDLTEKGWSVVTPQGAKKRKWTLSDKPDPAQVRKWVLAEINQTGYCSVAEVASKIEQDHGSVPVQEIGKAVDDLIKAGHFYVHAPDRNPDVETDALRGASASDWVMETVSPEYKVVTKPEAGKRGWITKEDETIQLSGEDARHKVLPLLKNLAQLYKTGGKSPISYLEVSGLKLPAGGIFNVQLQNLSPDDVRTLDELFDIALDLAELGQETEVQLVISDPVPDCKLVEQLKTN